MIWFGLVLWYINHCWLFNTKSSWNIYIKYIWFGLVWFYGISAIGSYLMPNPLYTYILNIYDLVWLVLWHINHCRLFNAKYIYIKYIGFGLVWFYGISTNVGHSMPNPFFTVSTHILNIRFINTFCRYTQLDGQTVLFQTTQFSMNHLFARSLNVKQFYLTNG